MYSVYQEEPHTEFSVSRTTTHVFMTSESIVGKGKLWFCLSNNRERPALSNQNCAIWIPHLHKMDLLEDLGGHFHYKR